MMPQSHSEQYEIEIAILIYLLNHPDSQDTLEGISQWWLLERYIRQQIEVISQALSELINKGLVVEFGYPLKAGQHIGSMT